MSISHIQKTVVISLVLGLALFLAMLEIPGVKHLQNQIRLQQMLKR